MITLQKVGDALKFTFTDNPLYLQNGTIEVPVNTLTLVTDSSDLATFKKSATNDIFVCASYDELGMTKSELETWFKNNACSTGGGTDTGTVQTMIDESISGKADVSDVYTKSQTSGATEIATALSGKQDTLSAGTNITIVDNVISAEGGGGKAISAGTNISVTTGETADTVSCTLPISAGTGTNSIIIGYNNTDSFWQPIASGDYSIASGTKCKARGKNSLAFGYYNDVYGENDVAIGYQNTISSSRNSDAFAFGLSNTITTTDYTGISARAAAVGGYKNIVKSFVEFGVGNSNDTSYSSNIFGDSGNTLFSVGNGDGTPSGMQTTIHRHNAFEIRQNGDIYIADTNDTSTSNYYEKPMIKLQDNLGTTTSAVTSGSTDAVTSGGVYNQMGGLKLQQITQADYDALVQAGTVDASTLYIITNVVN